MKYTVSNNIVITGNGRTLAISAGQQSRILATQLACDKYLHWLRLQSGEVTDIISPLKSSLTNKIKIAGQLAISEPANCETNSLTLLASDGYIPFVDNIELAAVSGINMILEPNGAKRAADIEQKAKDNLMTLVRTPMRYFYH